MPTSQSARSITGHLCDAAIALDHFRNPEVARTWVADACLEALGNNPQLPEIANFLLLAMSLQRDACRNDIL